jgi:hypothetical protein
MFEIIKLYVVIGAGLYLGLMLHHGSAFNEQEFVTFMLGWPMMAKQFLTSQ